MQQTICAKVNPRLLTKADRLFIGSVDGRVIEILQNARRAGATEVRISNKDEIVTVQDNGSGIEDFQKLLDLGGSGWDEQLEAGEDPAGVGLFSLAPRKVTIISGGRQTVIDKNGWTGEPVEVTEIDEAVTGTILKFRDEKPWNMDIVEKHAIFAGIKVIVDGKYCHAMPFCSSEAEHYDKPGCKIEVAEEISKYHRNWTSSWYHGRVLVNFHGQVVQLDHWP
ncbi:MAG: ATP-binding protein, partial [Planctomycetes bacterium]|nr:ATP-binding protein [Planctomycetota bacterium]